MLLLVFSMLPIEAQGLGFQGNRDPMRLETEFVERALHRLRPMKDSLSLEIPWISQKQINRMLLNHPRLIISVHREMLEEERLYQESLKHRERIIDPNKPMVALTFDDGPRPTTDRVFAALKKHNAVATFFVIGMYVHGRRDLLKQMVEAGNEIGNHSWSHLNLREITFQEVESQIIRTDEAILRATGVRPAFVRPPMGMLDGALKTVVGQRQIAMWNLDTLDWKHKDWQKTMASVVGHVRDGDVILVHDLVESTATNIEEMIVYLIGEGYQLVTMSELVKYRNVTSKVVRFARP